MSARAVLVIGASSGIGRASAERFAADGDALVLMARSDTALDDAAAACRRAGASEVAVVPGDASDRDDLGRAVEATLSAHGRIDVVLHTATVMAYGSIEALPSEVFQTVVDTAIHGTAHLARVVLPVLRRQGRGTLIVVNSLLGSVTIPNMGAYATAKWGQRAVLRTMQQETRDARDVHVCIVSPGSINTPIYYQAANFTGRETRPPWPVLPPEAVAAAITRLAEHPRAHTSVPVGPANPVIIAGFRLLPFVYDRLAGPLFGALAQTRRSMGPTSGNVHEPRPADDRVFGHWPDRTG